MLDRNLNTAWCEDVEGAGIGESILITFDNKVNIQGVKIYGGYWKNESIYQKNAKPKLISIYDDNGNAVEAQLNNEMRVDVIPLNFKNTQSIKIVVNNVTLGIGKDAEDTLISEIVVY